MLIFLKKNTEAIAWLLIGTGIALVATFCCLIYANKLGWGQDVFSIERTGQAGSFVGGTTGALWALAGVLFFKSALMLQRESLNKQIESLNVQREELKLQREELRLQREEMTSTRTIFEQQSFETTFFNLLSRLDKQIEIQSLPQLCRELNKIRQQEYYEEKEKNDKEAIESYNQIKIINGSIIRPFITTLKTTLEIIEQHNKESTSYRKILFSSIPEDYQIIIFYESSIDNELKTLINK